MRTCTDNIKKIGINTWIENFPHEFTVENYNSLVYNSHRLFVDIQEEVDNEIKDSMWVLYARLTKGIIHEIIDANFDTSNKTKGYGYKGNKLTEFPNTLARFKGVLRWLKYNNKFKSFSPSENIFIVIEAPSEEMHDYGELINKDIHYLDESYFFPIFQKSSGLMNKKVELVTNKFIARILETCEQSGLLVDNKLRKSLFCDIRSDIEHVLHINSSISGKILKKINNKPLFIKNSGNLFLRSLSVVHKRHGGEVVGFSHGNNIGAICDCGAAGILMGTVNSFISANKFSKELFDLTVKKCFKKELHVSFIPKFNIYYQNLYRDLSSDRVPNCIKSIMVIEFPLSPWQYSWKMHLELNLRRAKIIKEGSDIRLILKKHPDRLEESKGIYEKYYDEVITTPFEEVYDSADLYIFSEITTTTFGFAVMTNKPIIIFSEALKFVWGDVKKILKKRCIVIDSSFSSDGRLVFNASDLIKAIKSKPLMPNKEYVHKYMLGLNNES
jgi:hypothetical protein